MSTEAVSTAELAQALAEADGARDPDDELAALRALAEAVREFLDEHPASARPAPAGRHHRPEARDT